MEPVTGFAFEKEDIRKAFPSLLGRNPNDLFLDGLN
jgi:hypothetical protein